MNTKADKKPARVDTGSETPRGEVLLYRTKDGKTALDVRLAGDTVWLSQAQMAKLFDRDQSVVSRHVTNVFTETELDRKSNMQKMHIGKSDKPIVFYSLDTIISVGYRVKSKRGTQFRIWATQTLKDHLTRGYTLNRQRLEQNAHELEAALRPVRQATTLQWSGNSGPLKKQLSAERQRLRMFLVSEDPDIQSQAIRNNVTK